MLNSAIGGLGFTGQPTLSSFNSKAEVIKWAIEFTATNDEKYNRVPDYEKAQALYDFISKNVTLPDIPADPQGEFFKELKNVIAKELGKKKIKEEATPLPSFSPLAPISNKIISLLRENKFLLIKGEDEYGLSSSTFRLDGDREYLDVTIIHSICPHSK